MTRFDRDLIAEGFDRGDAGVTKFREERFSTITIELFSSKHVSMSQICIVEYIVTYGTFVHRMKRNFKSLGKRMEVFNNFFLLEELGFSEICFSLAILP